MFNSDLIKFEFCSSGLVKGETFLTSSLCSKVLPFQSYCNHSLHFLAKSHECLASSLFGMREGWYISNKGSINQGFLSLPTLASIQLEKLSRFKQLMLLHILVFMLDWVLGWRWKGIYETTVVFFVNMAMHSIPTQGKGSESRWASGECDVCSTVCLRDRLLINCLLSSIINKSHKSKFFFTPLLI